jgi:hypothetical protein
MYLRPGPGGLGKELFGSLSLSLSLSLSAEELTLVFTHAHITSKFDTVCSYTKIYVIGLR